MARMQILLWTDGNVSGILDPKILDPPFEVGVHICPILAVTAIIWSLLARQSASGAFRAAASGTSDA
jgi:hypothetical protein